MWHRRDRLLPLAAFVVLVLVGGLIVALLVDAGRSGREALEHSLTTEVETLAASQDRSQVGQLSTIRTFFAGRTIDLDVGSEADRAEFQDVADLLSELGSRTGFFFTDASGTVTQGFQLRDRDVIGNVLDRPGMDEALAAMARDRSAAWLPVAPGITTEVPTYAVVFAIREGEAPGGVLRGTFVIESDIGADDGLAVQLAELARGDTGEYLLYDQTGTVIAATDPSLIAAPVPDERYVTAEPGLHREGGQVRVVAELPNVGWRLAYRQDVGEFEDGLAGPLQRAGGIVVGAFLVLGAVTFIALTRRLTAARDEQARLRQLADSQEEFISIVSHELRTPVAGVLGFLQTTIDHWDAMTDSERAAAVLRAGSNARRLQGLTRDVLDSQSVDSGRMTYAMAPGDLREEVSVAVEAARVLYPGQRFQVDLAPGPVPVEMDADRIQQVLTNLIDNAVRMSPPEQPIELRLWTDEERALVSVRDHGPGLPPEMEQRVFDKFVRGRGTGVSGTGLGLYIARQILDAHGGGITVDSPPDDGATFTIELPRSEVAAPG